MHRSKLQKLLTLSVLISPQGTQERETARSESGDLQCWQSIASWTAPMIDITLLKISQHWTSVLHHRSQSRRNGFCLIAPAFQIQAVTVGEPRSYPASSTSFLADRWENGSRLTPAASPSPPPPRHPTLTLRLFLLAKCKQESVNFESCSRICWELKFNRLETKDC